MSASYQTGDPGQASSRPFEVRGVSHVALVCSDLAATVEFYNGVLGFPVVITFGGPAENPDALWSDSPMAGPGVQHFFFDIGNGDKLAFYWFPNGKPATPGITYPESSAHTSADGSMHHLAFEIPSDKLSEVWDHLEKNGIPFYFWAHSVEEIDSYREDAGIEFAGSAASKLAEIGKRVAEGLPVHTLNDVNDDTWIASFYFRDPNGINLELGAWCEPGYSKALASRNERPTRSGGRRQLHQAMASNLRS